MKHHTSSLQTQHTCPMCACYMCLNTRQEKNKNQWVQKKDSSNWYLKKKITEIINFVTSDISPFIPKVQNEVSEISSYNSRGNLHVTLEGCHKSAGICSKMETAMLCPLTIARFLTLTKAALLSPNMTIIHKQERPHPIYMFSIDISTIKLQIFRCLKKLSWLPSHQKDATHAPLAWQHQYQEFG